jgi:Spy/CpxP family protein refolding chaperone
MSRRVSPTIVAAMLLAILVPISLMAETASNRDNQANNSG